MTPTEIGAIFALTTWAVFRQTRTSRVSLGRERFKMAGIYALAGLLVGGFDTPSGLAGWSMIMIGLVLSFGVGVLRGRRTRLWIESSTVWSRGTALTVGLFLGLVAVKFALGTMAYVMGIDDGAGFGEVLVMIAIMIAVQAEIVRRRAVVLLHSSQPAASYSIA